jgi:tetratricopeptide (TPR) repeat protein
LVAVTVAAPLAAAACSGSTSSCDRAAALAKQGKLAQAQEAYVEAQRGQEGPCAEDGLTAIAQRRGRASTHAAYARVAEQVGDLTTARARYQSALNIDPENGEAAAGRLRVTRRPAELGELWFLAQRLHDEGYDDAARTEIVAVLRTNPNETVPLSLAPLAPSSTPSPRPSTPAGEAATSERGATTSWTVWSAIGLTTSLLAALVAAVAKVLKRLKDLEKAGKARAVEAEQTNLQQRPGGRADKDPPPY